MNSRNNVIHVVDDDASFRKSIYRLLSVSGYRVVLHESRERALENISNVDRGCILLDLQMSGLNGIEIQESLEKVGKALPLVFISGHRDISASVRSINAGAEDFLTKPVSKDVLLGAITRALEHYDQGQEHVSLVNSLRARFGTLTARENEVFALVVLGRLNKQIAHQLGTAAVSYTHLRAHETGRNLVCR